jgi:low temperature requirement protein LtrA
VAANRTLRVEGMGAVITDLDKTRIVSAILPKVRLRSAIQLERPASWLELFFDLIFVAAIAQIASPLAEDYSLAGLFRFAFFFTLVWWAWFDHTLFCSRFHVDDGCQRALTIAQIFVVAVMAANAKAGLDSRDAAGFGAAYGVMRLISMVQYLRVRGSTGSRSAVLGHAAVLGISAMLWIFAALFPLPLRFALWAAGVLLDCAAPWLLRKQLRTLPPDSAHLPERYGLFTIILLGEFVASVMRGMEAQESWPPLAFVSAVGGFCVAFACWWFYFERCKAAEPGAINADRSHGKLQVWLYIHLPMYLSLVVIGVGVEHNVGGHHFGLEEAGLMAGSALLLGFSFAALKRRATREPWDASKSAMAGT